MRTYISGRITGLPYEEVKQKFATAEQTLPTIGMEPVNPLKNGLHVDESWSRHMVRDIEMLMSCDAIYLLADWMDSKGARIERYIASEVGMKIFFEDWDSKDARVHLVKHAIEVVTGLTFDQYTTKSRNRTGYYCRMAFVNKVEKICKVAEIKDMIKRDHSTVIHCLGNYQDELKFNKEFREIVAKTDKIIQEIVSQ
jgi:hypothetical protein